MAVKLKQTQITKFEEQNAVLNLDNEAGYMRAGTVLHLQRDDGLFLTPCPCTSSCLLPATDVSSRCTLEYPIDAEYSMQSNINYAVDVFGQYLRIPTHSKRQDLTLITNISEVHAARLSHWIAVSTTAKNGSLFSSSFVDGHGVFS